MNAKISSIHVNGWFGDYDKLSMTRILMREHFAIDLDSQRTHYAFIGDSPNDAPMFAWFEHSVGVANVQEFATLIETKPRYITPGRSGLGFVELVDHLLAHTG
jgi:hydroxymethylpyrimidine pyrophosphatase-like HAD family hydrolase